MTIIHESLVCDTVINWPQCSMELKLKLSTYSNDKQFYYISYIWNVTNPADHPFRHDTEFMENSLDGDIIFRNTLSDVLVEYLQLNNNDLLKHSGSTTPDQYRKTVMKSISLLWD